MKTIQAFQIFLLTALAGLVGCNQYDPFHPDTTGLVGIWSIDNTLSRSADEEPVRQVLSVYPTHMEFLPGQGTVGVQGQWRDGGFWCTAKDGSGEMEAAKVIDTEHIELHLACFYPGDAKTLDLYKQEGSEEEKRAVAARYPTPLRYPPPFEVIPEGMTEYQLNMLPWKPDKIEPSPYPSAVREIIYSYHSDSPNRSELEVTVRDHVVIRTSGGNA